MTPSNATTSRQDRTPPGEYPLVPDTTLRPPVLDPTGRIRPDGRATSELRDELRRIPNRRNILAVVSCWVEPAIIIALGAYFTNPVVWVVIFVWMGRIHARFAALAHEAAHRLLFSSRRANDVVGAWFVAYPAFVPLASYRRAHMAHHRAEFGPDEPDRPLYAGYPITSTSLRRKLARDGTGRTGIKLAGSLLAGITSPRPDIRNQVLAIITIQTIMFAAATAAGLWWAYPVLWLGSWLTVWRVINRLRSIAEHGGMHASKDRRETTHSVRQHALARLCLVPHHIGWHLAHHVDSGIPHHHLRRYHERLRDAGYIPDGLEYPNYPSLWRALASRPRS